MIFHRIMKLVFAFKFVRNVASLPREGETEVFVVQGSDFGRAGYSHAELYPGASGTPLGWIATATGYSAVLRISAWCLQYSASRISTCIGE